MKIKTVLEEKIAKSRIQVRGVNLDMVQLPDVVQHADQWIDEGKRSRYIVFMTANDFVQSVQDKNIRDAVNESDLAVPDGMSMVILARLFGFPLKKRVYGPEFMLSILQQTDQKRYSHFFYGSTRETLDQLIATAKNRFPGLSVAGSYAPPFGLLSVEEDRAVVDLINNASPDFLWVGLGCPKQQLWMHAHRDRVHAPVMAGVGAAFDFISMRKAQAPAIMRACGFEWLFRLIMEPKRLWKRYIINNAVFMYYLCISLLRNDVRK